LVWLGVPLLATQATYQAGGVCPNLFVYIVKIYSHFLLAKLAIPTATRDSSDSMPGKQAENIFRLASFPAMINQESKARDCQRVRTGSKYKYESQAEMTRQG